MTKEAEQRRDQTDSPQITKESIETPTTTNQKSKAWSISEELFLNLVKSVQLIVSKIETIEDNVACMKSKQEAIMELLESLEKKVENLERESPVCREINSDVREIKKKTYALDQSKINDRLVMKNLPQEIIENKDMMKSVIQKVFTSLELDIQDTQFEAFATKAGDRKSANIIMKFSSEMLKSEVVSKFRKNKKKSNSLLVNKIANLADSHPLSGKFILIANKLTSYNTQLIQSARKYVPSHFNFVYDTPESLIMVNIGSEFHKIESNDDITKLVEETERKQKQELVDLLRAYCNDIKQAGKDINKGFQ